MINKHPAAFNFPLRRPRFVRLIFLASFILLVWLSFTKLSSLQLYAKYRERRFPLAWRYIHSLNNTGGAWYIPREWAITSEQPPGGILEAARLASEAALSKHERKVAFAGIPLLVHQTWKTTNINTWTTDITSWVEKWLSDAVLSKTAMAYFFWNDEGMRELVRTYEPQFMIHYESLTPVERSDIFRILVCKHFGGIYGDMDTEPLQHPATWVRHSDLAAWTDPETGKSYGEQDGATEMKQNERPVNIIWGIEADTNPLTDQYWRMGYEYPIQITQWAFASAPNHPVLSRFMDNFSSYMSGNQTTDQGDDPIARTGPAAVTLATKSWLEDRNGFRWNSLTGVNDGGKSKLIDDVLILPITGFSPGRTRTKMGSKSSADPDARLLHHFQGSWRHTNWKVEYGKFCRTFFGRCRKWSKETG